jgi:CO dehydrogenase/acetyl-CoA synthase beta subunit
MLNPKVMVGECSIQVMLRGELLMTIPHRLWESGVSEEGEVVWSGELRGDHTTMLLVRYLEGRIRGSEDQRDLFNRLDEFMWELKCPMWRKTLREEGIEEKKEKEDRERTKRGVENPVEVVEVVEVVAWRRAA